MARSLSRGALSASHQVPRPIGDQFVIISNDGVDPVNGAFAGYCPEGSALSISGQPFSITYVGGIR